MQVNDLSNANILKSYIQADDAGQKLADMESVQGFDVETSPIMRLGLIGRSLTSTGTITLLSVFRYTQDVFSEGFNALWPRIWQEVNRRKIDGLDKENDGWQSNFLGSLNKDLACKAPYITNIIQVKIPNISHISENKKEEIISGLFDLISKGRLQDIVRELYAIHSEGDKDFDLRRGYEATQRKVVGDILSEAGCLIVASGDMLKGLGLCAILQDFPALQDRCAEFIATYTRALLEVDNTRRNLIYPFYILARQNEGWRSAIKRTLGTYETGLAEKKHDSADICSQPTATSPARQAAKPVP